MFKLEAFRDVPEFKKEVADFAKYLKSSEPSKGFKEVYYPGEIEYLKELEQLEQGIFVVDATWAQLVELAQKYGVEHVM